MKCVGTHNTVTCQMCAQAQRGAAWHHPSQLSSTASFHANSAWRIRFGIAAPLRALRSDAQQTSGHQEFQHEQHLRSSPKMASDFQRPDDRNALHRCPVAGTICTPSSRTCTVHRLPFCNEVRNSCTWRPRFDNKAACILLTYYQANVSHEIQLPRTIALTSSHHPTLAAGVHRPHQPCKRHAEATWLGYLASHDLRLQRPPRTSCPSSEGHHNKNTDEEVNSCRPEAQLAATIAASNVALEAAPRRVADAKMRTPALTSGGRLR